VLATPRRMPAAWTRSLSAVQPRPIPTAWSS